MRCIWIFQIMKINLPPCVDVLKGFNVIYIFVVVKWSLIHVIVMAPSPSNLAK